ncbi:hypothetical protein L198_07171 [Cryptococcus wingfieldii CBS 7118]|uniref:DUF6534 domain-containing protein n=1 Tax=Cryptococcus wingfieldii CBS 7118 TaxID=1295528 RepID=A0A1E3IE20_9TREE|nr:hypothetical protein L198_07171 [Cryptococcus wingfieldii CBS 7118]ODN86809.1 hypothetical protein L198_07171 [Cryptococcus wingfieldii CBS 7118]
MPPLTPLQISQLEEYGQNHFGENKELAFVPMLLGFALTCSFFGLLVLQVLFWVWRTAKRDWWVIKVVVAHVFMSATAYMVLEFYWISQNFATGFGTYYRLYKFSPIADFFLITTIMQTPVSGFFSLRAFRLTGGNLYSAIVPNVLLFISFGSCIALRIVAPEYATQIVYSNHPVTFSVLFVWAVTAMIADLIVTFTIAYALLQSKLGFTGFVRTDKLIKKVIMYILPSSPHVMIGGLMEKCSISVEAQMIPTLSSLAFLITFATTPSTEISAIWLFTPLMYPIAFMAVLNSRKGLARQLAPRLGQVADSSQPPTLRTSSSNLTYDHPGLEGVLPQLDRSPKESGRVQAGQVAAFPACLKVPREGEGYVKEEKEGKEWKSEEGRRDEKAERDEEERIGMGQRLSRQRYDIISATGSRTGTVSGEDSVGSVNVVLGGDIGRP